MKVQVTEKVLLTLSELAPRIEKMLEKQGFKGVFEIYPRIGKAENGEPEFKGFDVSFTREEERA